MLPLTCSAECTLPTEFGCFTVRVYNLSKEITVIISGDVSSGENINVRIHSACFTGEVLSSQKCDCKQQLDLSLKHISKFGGIIIYVPEDGRGIGLTSKIQAYGLQEKGYDTIVANQCLGLPVDMRTYEDAITILKSMDIRSVNLITNNPLKIKAVIKSGITINHVVRFPIHVTKHSANYIKTKFIKTGHMFQVANVHSKSNGDPVYEKLYRKRPFVHVNFALSDCGDVACDPSGKIDLSCKKDWERVHLLREKYNAIAVGVNTWTRDHPRLNVREEHLHRKPFSQPDRVIFAGKTKVEINSEERRTFVIANCNGYQHANAVNICMTDHILQKPLEELYENQVNSLLVEGGLTLIHSFIDQKVVDLITIYVRTSNEQKALAIIKHTFPYLPVKEYRMESLGQGSLLSLIISERPFVHDLDFFENAYL